MSHNDSFDQLAYSNSLNEMSRVTSTVDNSSRQSISMNGVPVRGMTSTAGPTGVEKKRHTRSNPPEAFIALGAEEELLTAPSSSSSSSSRTVLPIGVRELKHAPRLDECIARLLGELEDVKVPSPSFLTTRIRGKNNDSNGIVSALRLYPVQEALACYISMKDLEAIACTSSALSNCLDLKETRQFWEDKVMSGRGDDARKRAERDAYYEALENMPERRKRKLDEDEELPYAPLWRPQSRGPKRIKAAFGHV